MTQHHSVIDQRLSLITLARDAGLSLKEIASVPDPRGRPTIDRPRLLAKANELDQRRLKSGPGSGSE